MLVRREIVLPSRDSSAQNLRSHWAASVSDMMRIGKRALHSLLIEQFRMKL